MPPTFLNADSLTKESTQLQLSFRNMKLTQRQTQSTWNKRYVLQDKMLDYINGSLWLCIKSFTWLRPAEVLQHH